MRHPGDYVQPGSIDVNGQHDQNACVGNIVYIMASKQNGTLYVGVTADPTTRIWEHRDKIYPRSFTARYNVTRLVWYREFDSVVDAIKFEKQLKRWRRVWKIQLIEVSNPDWNDLYLEIAGP